MSGTPPTGRKPPWIKVRLPTGERQARYNQVRERARDLGLHTVCEEAKCPNIGECWGGGTATFMVMGDICTRGCRFCAVTTRRKGGPLDPLEPQKVANAIAEMQLDYVVVTSVDRDDLPDQGADHLAACIREIQSRNPRTLLEVLIPDFRGDLDLLQRVIDAEPTVLAHNVETIPRLTAKVRDPRATWDQSVAVLAHVKATRPAMFTKSSLMVGLGETLDEVVDAMRALRAVGVDFLTLGQYLQPTPLHLKISEYVTPERFAEYERLGLDLGFTYVASGPLVRSSYKAGEFFIHQHIEAMRGHSAPSEGSPEWTTPPTP
ncbi:MAG: lipoyl synthase [Deltaproteobacteria bacterium]|nr:lipoyl synthase [Deltaproteobacteria bacterium]MBK9367508.1 lipoyl synthase [Deltaproteobacteria bacterium]MBK9645927.1 lipoyl synthase [Deltaproteobacteria bacterium]